MPADISGADLTIPKVRDELTFLIRACAKDLDLLPEEMEYSRVDGVRPATTAFDEIYGAASCFYAHTDRPGCLVGQWLNMHGVTVDELAKVEHKNADEAVLAYMEDTPTTVTAFLNSVQDRQDDGFTWQKAVSLAFKAFGPNNDEGTDEDEDRRAVPV